MVLMSCFLLDVVKLSFPVVCDLPVGLTSPAISPVTAVSFVHSLLASVTNRLPEIGKSRRPTPPPLPNTVPRMPCSVVVKINPSDAPTLFTLQPDLVAPDEVHSKK